MAKVTKGMIDPDDVVMLLIDHQSGLFNLVKDIPVPDLRRNAIALAKLATLLKLPVITTASVPDGPNGPLIPEIHQVAPHAQFVARQGQINAWDMPAFVAAIEKTGRKTLVIAATLTSVCLAFPSISAVAAGYKVYAVVDASGNWSKMATDLTIARLAQAGAIPIDTLAARLRNAADLEPPRRPRLRQSLCRSHDAELPPPHGELRQGSGSRQIRPLTQRVSERRPERVPPLARLRKRGRRTP